MQNFRMLLPLFGLRHGGCETIFKFVPDATETVLYAFSKHKHRGTTSLCRPDEGRKPVARHLRAGIDCNGFGCGNVFRLKTRARFYDKAADIEQKGGTRLAHRRG